MNNNSLPYHQPVMLAETLDFLKVQPGKWYVDATVGLGGHSQAILAQGGQVIGLDRDAKALGLVKARYPQLHLVHGNLSDLDILVRSITPEPILGILFDFGTSSYQLDTAERGFSFMTVGPLDMRMDQSSGLTAADLVNTLSEGELYALFAQNGEIRNGRKIAKAIIQARLISPFQTTKDLADLIETQIPRTSHLHPATKIFQALRIEVNDEINHLKKGLQKAINLIAVNGRVVTLTFHEGEDRPVKKLFLDSVSKGVIRILTKKPLTPGEKEIKNNPRARSVKLRAIEKI